VLGLAWVIVFGLFGCGSKDIAAESATFTLPGGATMEMVWIAPGTFTMGSSPPHSGGGDDEGPPHLVTIRQGFYLGKVELTQGQWESVIGTRPWAGQSQAVKDPYYPTVYISWDDMQAFMAKLNQGEGKSVYRLPTEAEWEYACRAGTTTRWSFGDEESQLGDYAWYEANVGEEEVAHRVGTKRPNPWGVCDLHGNVWEWCGDWYGSYTSGSQTDPVGPSTGLYRVLRGGSFEYPAEYARSANRGHILPAHRGGGVGARLRRQWP